MTKPDYKAMCKLCGDMPATRMRSSTPICEFCEDRLETAAWLNREFNMTIEVYNRLAAKQNYRCAALGCKSRENLIPYRNAENVVMLICKMCDKKRRFAGSYGVGHAALKEMLELPEDNDVEKS